MEEGMSLPDLIKEVFEVGEVDIKTYSPLALAYIGDAFFDIVIRTAVVGKGNRAAEALHRQASSFVNAKAQAGLAEAVQDLLTEEEAAVYRRGRNAKSHSIAKNAGLQDYRRATGLEALMGWLYLRGDTGRALELVKEGLARTGREL